jgi:hypothetical protein
VGWPVGEEDGLDADDEEPARRTREVLEEVVEFPTRQDAQPGQQEEQTGIRGADELVGGQEATGQEDQGQADD